jgi:hypothetical protein
MKLVRTKYPLSLRGAARRRGNLVAEGLWGVEIASLRSQ